MAITSAVTYRPFHRMHPSRPGNEPEPVAAESLKFEISPSADPDLRRGPRRKTRRIPASAASSPITWRPSAGPGQGLAQCARRIRAPISARSRSAVLHYAQEIFEGLKAYRASDGGVACSAPSATRAASRIRPSGWRCRSCRKPCSSGGRGTGEDRPRLDPRRRGQPLSAPLHVRQRGVPRRQAGRANISSS